MNDYNNSMPQAGHRLELIGREQLTISGVEDVERFDETGIVMSTAAGTLVVTGEDLHIGKLSLDGGELHVDGRIDAVSYETAARSGRLFPPPVRVMRRGPALAQPLQPLSSPSCWGWPPGCCMTCCGPSA